MDEIEMAFFHGDFSSLREMISEMLYGDETSDNQATEVH